MSSDRPIGRDHHRDLVRRALAFSSLGVLATVALFAVARPNAWSSSHLAAVDLLARAANQGGAVFDWPHVPGLVAVGVAAGSLAGMLGMGGGVMKVAGMLVVFRLDILLARAVSLTTMLAATASAARVHVQNGTVLWQVVRPMLLPSFGGVMAGVLLGQALPRTILEHFFALFVIFLGFTTLGQVFSDPNEQVLEGPYEEELDARGKLGCGVVGAFHGFVCGLLGISGGVIAMPMQQAIARVPVRNAVANSVVLSAWCTAFGSVTTVAIGLARGDFAAKDIIFASIAIGVGAVMGGQVGARLTGLVPVYVLRILLAGISFCAGVSILGK